MLQFYKLFFKIIRNIVLNNYYSTFKIRLIYLNNSYNYFEGKILLSIYLILYIILKITIIKHF